MHRLQRAGKNEGDGLPAQDGLFIGDGGDPGGGFRSQGRTAAGGRMDGSGGFGDESDSVRVELRRTVSGKVRDEGLRIL